MSYTLTGTRHYPDGTTKEFSAPTHGATYYQALERFHYQMQESDSTFVGDLQ